MENFLPKNRFKYCPVCGSRQFIHDNVKSFLCGDCGFVFFTNPASAVAAIIENKQGEILLTRRAFEPKKNFLDLPGGFVDPMETNEAALRREIMEELNLEVKNMSYITSVPNQYLFSGVTVYTTDMAFKCEVEDFGTLMIQDDVADALFLKPKDVDLNLIGFESIKRILNYYIHQYDALLQTTEKPK